MIGFMSSPDRRVASPLAYTSCKFYLYGCILGPWLRLINVFHPGGPESVPGGSSIPQKPDRRRPFGEINHTHWPVRRQRQDSEGK
jgi:hypothetical protein